MDTKAIRDLYFEVLKRGLAIEPLTKDDQDSFMLTDMETDMAAAPVTEINTLEAIQDWIEDIPCKYSDEEAEAILAEHKEIMSKHLRYFWFIDALNEKIKQKRKTTISSEEWARYDEILYHISKAFSYATIFELEMELVSDDKQEKFHVKIDEDGDNVEFREIPMPKNAKDILYEGLDIAKSLII